jgi:hypothetical protein
VPYDLSPSPTLAPTLMTDPRFRPGAYITDGQHLYWVRRARVTSMSQQADVLVVEDCMTNMLLELDVPCVASTCALVRLDAVHDRTG